MSSSHKQYTILFFDDWHLARRDHVQRHIGQPELVGRFTDPYLDTSFGYPTVFIDQSTGNWRCLYQGFLYDQYINSDDVVTTGNKLRYRSIPAIIESKDCIHWEIPDLTKLNFKEERRIPHQVLPLQQFREWGPAFYDQRADNPEERIKAFVSFGKDQLDPIAPLWVSSDGITWKQPDGATWHPVGIDPAVTAYWNHVRQSYCIAARPGWGDRRIAVYETRDWKEYSIPELAMQADALDTPMAEIYGMPVFEYEDIFVGFIWLFHPDRSLISRPGKGYLGKNDSQLSYSMNGWHFQRTLRDPFIGNSRSGEHSSSVIYPSSLVRNGDILRICSSSAMFEHGQGQGTPDNPQSELLFHELRLDGFVYLSSEGGWGSIVTRPLFTDGNELMINVEAPYGIVKIQIMDEFGDPIDGFSYEECIPMTGDQVRWVPVWQKELNFGAIQNRFIRIGIQMLNAKLYSIRGNFYPTGGLDLGIFQKQGTKPPPNSLYWK